MPLPNFLVIGATKAGTTSLYEYMRGHPDIFMPAAIKEPRFFCYGGSGATLRIEVRDLAAYRSLFDGVTTETAIGEASPHYLLCPGAAESIRETLADVRLIVSLRNPVDRAYSTFVMNLRNEGRNAGTTFLEALERDPWLQLFYFEDLQRFYSLFAEERIKVILFDELVNRPEHTMRGIFSFLGVSEDFRPDTSIAHNPGGMPKNPLLDRIGRSAGLRKIGRAYLPKGLAKRIRRVLQKNLESRPLSAQERATASAVFAEDIERTQALVKRDLSHWLPV